MMYDTSDTIAAVSSPPGPGARHIIRISGPDALRIVAALAGARDAATERGIQSARIVAGDIPIQCEVYSFPGPHSYTGDDLAELHITANQAVAAVVLEAVTSAGARLAEPGEFTSRAYLSGKLDLAQAEAVAEIIAAGNRTHLAAAEKLLEGKLTSSIADIRKDMLELISLIEAGLDFSEEGIDFITVDCAAARLRRLSDSLEGLLSGSIGYEAMLDLPAVAIAGATNAGKSSLLNALLGKERAIVSDQPATTRDILTDILRLPAGDCVIFDCAGLSAMPRNVIDELSQAAAVKAASSADLVILCLDASKDSHAEDEKLFSMLSPAASVRVATKSDLADGKEAPDVALRTSAKTGQGVAELRKLISERFKRRTSAENSSQIALTQRHLISAKSALDDLARASEELARSNSEIASMFLRSAWNALGPIESEPVDEAILSSIFSRFCIGK
jgi:tRNA modification GTPase